MCYMQKRKKNWAVAKTSEEMFSFFWSGSVIQHFVYKTRVQEDRGRSFNWTQAVNNTCLEGTVNIPCDVCHGAQCIITLGNGDSGHLVHSQDSCFLLGQHVHQLRVLSWIDEADQSRCILHHIHLMHTQSRVENRSTDLEADKAYIVQNERSVTRNNWSDLIEVRVYIKATIEYCKCFLYFYRYVYFYLFFDISQLQCSVLVLVFFSSDFFYAMKLTPSVPVQTHPLVSSVVYYSYQGSFMSDQCTKTQVHTGTYSIQWSKDPVGCV